ncbi:MAG: nucleotide pyrophosphohydrolase [Bacillota bacterium]
MRELTEEIIRFRDARSWRQFHNPKDLAISLSLEAGELLENFQWKSSEDAVSQERENIQDELADVLIYALILAHELDIDVAEAVRTKLAKNNAKYPVEKSFGSATKYTRL